MSRLRILPVVLLVLGLAGCATARHAPLSVAVEAELQRLESAKWHPSSMGSQERLLSLFADDFVTVEYGADVHGGVDRRSNGKASMSGPDGAKLLQFLDQGRFELSDWRFIHLDSCGVVVSYHVSAPDFAWNAYATSVWAWREGRWQTVFYQASTAK